jgi:hypothetical protein
MTRKRFCFEATWPRFPGFLQAVEAGWQPSLSNTDAFCSLDYKLRNIMNTLRSWSYKFVGSVLLQLVVANEVVHKLDQAQDIMALSPEEIELRKELKMKCLGLASLSRSVAR